MSQGWTRVSGRLLNSSRPFYVYPWKAALLVDVKVLLWMICCPMVVGILLACLPFNPNVENSAPGNHPIYAYIGMGMLGIQTGHSFGSASSLMDVQVSS